MRVMMENVERGSLCAKWKLGVPRRGIGNGVSGSAKILLGGVGRGGRRFAPSAKWKLGAPRFGVPRLGASRGGVSWDVDAGEVLRGDVRNGGVRGARPGPGFRGRTEARFHGVFVDVCDGFA